MSNRSLSVDSKVAFFPKTTLYRFNLVLNQEIIERVEIYLIFKNDDYTVYKRHEAQDGVKSEVIVTGQNYDQSLFKAKICAIRLDIRGYDKAYFASELLF